MRQEKRQDWLFGEHKRRDVTSEHFDTKGISEDDVELSENAKRALLVLRSAEDSRNLKEFYKLACLELERTGRIDRAVMLNDAMLPPCADQSERFLLSAAIARISSGVEALESTSRMRNSVDPAQLVLKNLHKHPVDVALKMLRVRLDRLEISEDNAVKSELRAQILEKTRDLEIFRDVLKKSKLAQTWIEVESKCKENPVSVARELARLGEHPLARRVCDTFVLSDSASKRLREELTELWAFDLLTSSSSSSSSDDAVSRAFHMLKSLESASSSRVCENILKRLGDRMLHTQLLLVHFLQQLGFGTSRLAVLELSLRVLTRLSASLARQLSHLIGKPALILESLLMANRLEAVKLLLSETRFVSLRNDDLSIRLWRF